MTWAPRRARTCSFRFELGLMTRGAMIIIDVSIFQGQLESKGKHNDDMAARLKRAEKNVEDLENASIPMSAPAFCTPQKGNRPKSSSGE